jgi:hypothetical protein
MKHTITGFIVADVPRYGNDRTPQFTFAAYRPNLDIWPDRVVVCEHSFEVDIPNSFDARPGLVANLEEKKARVHAECAARVKELNERIQSLLAIEMAEEA